MRLETRPVDQLPDQVEALAGFSAVVLADVSVESLTENQQTTLRSYVRDLGRGLLAIGGDTSFGQGEYVGTPLDDALPVRYGYWVRDAFTNSFDLIDGESPSDDRAYFSLPPRAAA